MASWEIPSENVKVDFGWELPVTVYQFEELLGEGTFGEVYRANLYGLQVAVKKLKTSGLDSNVITGTITALCCFAPAYTFCYCYLLGL